jgi:hypothetical protein
MNAYSVLFPAPFGPTTAIRESSPTSMLTLLITILSGVYPNVTSFSCSSGGDIFSVSGNLPYRLSRENGKSR